MAHECPSCGRSYYCAHKNCGYKLDVKCDECEMKDRYAKPKPIEPQDTKE